MAGIFCDHWLAKKFIKNLEAELGAYVYVPNKIYK